MSSYLQLKKRAFMSIVNGVKGFVRTVSGVPPISLEDCVDEDSLIDWKLYGNSVQDGEPTPETPVEVQSVGEKTVNLLPYPYYNSSRTLNGITFTVNNDGTIIMNGTGVFDTVRINDFTLLFKHDISEGTYFLSGCPAGGGTYSYRLFVTVHNYYSDGKSRYYNDIGSGTSIDVKDNCTITVAIRIGDEIGTLNNLVFKPQLQLGSSATAYEPYNKYKIPVTARGKNLFDTYGFSANSIAKPSSTRVLENTYGTTISTTEPSSSITVTQVYNSDYAIGSAYNGCIHIGLNDDIKIGQRYIISFDIDIINNPANATAIYLYPNGVENTNGKAVSLNGKRVYGIFTFNEHTSVKTRRTIELRICGVSFTMSNIMITPDYIEDITYEPYHAPIQTTLYLDEPLRKVGDYADYVDFGKGEVVRSVKENELLSSYDYASYKLDGLKFYGFAVPFKDMYSGRREPGFCTHLQNKAKNENSPIWLAVGNYYVYMSFPDIYNLSETNSGRITAFKAYLTEQAEAGTPLKVTYILAEPTHTPISIPKLPTIKGTTIYEIDTSLNASNMEATYYSTVKGE